MLLLLKEIKAFCFEQSAANNFSLDAIVVIRQSHVFSEVGHVFAAFTFKGTML